MSKMSLLKILLGLIFLSITICFAIFFFLKWDNTKVFFQKQSGLQICARILGNKEFNSNFRGFNYFKNRNIRNKYKALKIDIKNDSGNEYLLEKNGIDLQVEQPFKISKKLKTNFALAPLIVAGTASALFIFTFGLAIIPSVIAGTTIGASTNLINVKKSNKKMSENINNRSHDLVHGVLIPPRETVSKIFFIKNENVKDKFNLKLLNLENNNYFNFFLICS